MDIELDRINLSTGGFHLAADTVISGPGITALIGPSGAGKSSLLHLIAGFIAPTRGELRIGGAVMTPVPPDRRPVSLVFQDHNLFPHLTTGQNVVLGLAPDPRITPARRAQVDDALTQVGLSGKADDMPGTLSGGERSRAALARALLRNRPVLLLDEPFAALGPGLRHAMLDLVAKIAAERALSVLLVTHQPDDARRIAAQTALVAAGQVYAPMPTDQLFNDPPPVLAAYLGSP